MEPAGHEVVLSNDMASRAAWSESPMGYLDAPGVPDGTEGRLVVPTDSADLQAVVPATSRRRWAGDAAVDQDQFQPFLATLRAEMLQHQLGGDVLVRRRGHDECPDRQTGDIHGDDPLCALGAANGPPR